MPIAYPKFFEELLGRDRKLRAGVDALAVAFDEWLNSSWLPFFTDYTNHGIDHLNCVMATADHLIPDAARGEFTPSDAAVLISAILLHDSAMHISEAGFYQLIRGEAVSWNVPEFSDRPWPTLWDEFLFSAKRWDERRLRDVLGETPSGELRAQVRDPFVHYDDLSDTDRKLIGEFIRRHHPRMAHEFARYGVPGKTLISLEHSLHSDFRDIAGLVARSHGLPVRACVDYLKARYHRREYKGVHAVYLMTLLRVSDYLQIQAARAPVIVFQYRHIPSKLSELEWKAHNAITNITQTHDDPESIEIQAHPDDVHTYLRIKEWLSGIQEELDDSWAVLGETYGSLPKLRSLGLILRRVRSNLDHIEEFSKEVSYVPQRIELAVARPDLLKLLVGPLYDNVPSIGIRELVQNAVDAVREREVLQEKYPELRDITLLDQQHDIEVWVGSPDEHGRSWVTVSDRGVGMSVETIRDYFLTAGASFRTSDAWKREFETDDSPRSRVLRSGRFGVGVLAGFLLGSSMEIATRYIRSDFGIRFTTALELRPIELRHDPTLPVGTTIRVQIPRAVRKQLLGPKGRVNIPDKYEWYIYDHPSVVRLIGKSRKPLPQRFRVTAPGTNTFWGFRKLQDVHDYSVYWTYRDLPNLNVNGMFISDSARRATFSTRYSASGQTDMWATVNHPKICVEDPDGSFPLNLRRSNITEPAYSFESSLVMEVIDDFLAYLLVNCHDESRSGGWAPIRMHPAIASKLTFGNSPFYGQVSPLLATQNGITLFSPVLHSNILKDSIYLMGQPTPPGFIRLSGQSMIVCSSFEGAAHPYRWPVKVLEPDIPFLCSLAAARILRTKSRSRGDLRTKLVQDRTVAGLRLLAPTRIALKIADPVRWLAEAKQHHQKARPHPRHHSFDLVEQSITQLCKGLEIQNVVGDYSFVQTPGCPEMELSLPRLATSAPRPDVNILQVCLGPEKPDTKPMAPGLVTRRWQEIIRSPVIPFDLATRRRELKHAYEVLEPFIQGHEAMKRKGVLY